MVFVIYSTFREPCLMPVSNDVDTDISSMITKLQHVISAPKLIIEQEVSYDHCTTLILSYEREYSEFFTSVFCELRYYLDQFVGSCTPRKLFLLVITTYYSKKNNILERYILPLCKIPSIISISKRFKFAEILTKKLLILT